MNDPDQPATLIRSSTSDHGTSFVAKHDQHINHYSAKNLFILNTSPQLATEALTQIAAAYARLSVRNRELQERCSELERKADRARIEGRADAAARYAAQLRRARRQDERLKAQLRQARTDEAEAKRLKDSAYARAAEAENGPTTVVPGETPSKARTAQTISHSTLRDLLIPAQYPFYGDYGNTQPRRNSRLLTVSLFLVSTLPFGFANITVEMMFADRVKPALIWSVSFTSALLVVGSLIAKTLIGVARDRTERRAQGESTAYVTQLGVCYLLAIGAGSWIAEPGSYGVLTALARWLLTRIGPA